MAIRKVRQPPGWHRAYYFRHWEGRGLPGPIKRRPGWRLTHTTWLFRAPELMTVKPYPLGYAYTPNQPIAEAAIHSRHEHIDDAARALLSLTAPYKQAIVEEEGELGTWTRCRRSPPRDGTHGGWKRHAHQ